MDRVSKGQQRDGHRARYSSPRPASGTRYRSGTRRVTAEPLTASWRPTGEQPAVDRGGVRPRAGVEDTPADDDKPPERSSSWLRKLAATYGWRIYALPVLLALTVVVIVDTTQTSDEDVEKAAEGSGSAAVQRSPAATENPAQPVDLDIPTAKLPEGGDYTKSGKGSWHVVPGSGDKVGKGGEQFTYTVEIEDGVDPASFAGDDSFGESVEMILSDPRSWTGGGDISLQRVDASYPNPDFRVSLTTPDTVRRPDICGASIPYEASCRNSDVQGQDRVVINLARWIRGALAFSGDNTGYRQYAINHEVGHALGLGHEGCRKDGALAPVMMQQTFGVANDYVAKLNNRTGGDQGTVDPDGKVCKPNAWPNPQAD